MRPFLFLPALLLPLAALPGPRAVAAGPPLTAAALRCEYRENPLGLDERAPRLSWVVRGEGRDRRQTRHEIRVASSRALLAAGRPDFWAPGPVASAESLHVAYGGRALRRGERAWWQVRLTDEAGRVGPWSAPAWWEAGPAAATDWAASRWIGLPLPRPESGFTLADAKWYWYPEGNPRQSAPGGARYFRKALTLPAAVTRGLFLVAVDNHFTLWVNGKPAGNGGGWQGAARVEVGPLLRVGENVLALRAENADPQGGPAGVMARLYLETPAGPRVVDLDRTWRAHNQEAAGWRDAGFGETGWREPLEIGKAGDPPWGMPAVLDTDPAPSPYLRRSFRLVRRPREARAYVTALGLFQLWLNGRRVSEDVLAPGWTDTRKRVQYRTYDVTPFLRAGENHLGAILGDGWYSGSLGFDLRRNHFGPSPPRLRLQLHLRDGDGTEQVVGTDRDWTAALGPIVASDLYSGETYDARRAGRGEPAFGAAGPADGPWTPVTIFTDQAPEIVAQVDPPIRFTEDLPTRAVTEPKPGVFVFDLGQNMVGWARLTVRAGRPGQEVTLRFAEVLNPDGTVYRDNLRMAKATDVYRCAGGPGETWEPHFTYHGFRYVEVTGYPGRPRADAVTGRVFHSDMPATSEFECSSELVNRLYRNVWWGQRGNLMSVPTDCPQRDERLGWMGDAQLFARTSCWYMDMGAFYTKWMRDIVDAQSPAGAFSDVAPRAVDLADGAPAWAEAGVVIPWTLYRCYGDRRILERHYPAVKKYVDLIHAANPNRLWLQRRNNDFGDWVAAGEQTNKA